MKFIIKGEDYIDYIPNIQIQKIKLKSGRVKTIVNKLILKPVTSGKDWENMNLSFTDGEVANLYKIDVINTRARGTTSFANVNSVRERALRKLKMATALTGGNCVFIAAQNTEGNKYGNDFSFSTETFFTGVSYSDKLLDYNKFKDLCSKNKNHFRQVEKLILGWTDSEISIKSKEEVTISNSGVNSRVQGSNSFNNNNWQDFIDIIDIKLEDENILVRTNYKNELETVYKVIYYSDKEITLFSKSGNQLINILLKTVE